MASQRLRCKQCHQRFSRLQGSRRLYCETCRPPRTRAVVELPGAPSRPGAIESTTLADLERVERVDTIEGQALLALARDADTLTGAARVAAVRGIMALKPVAFEGTAPRDRDRLDELADRRAALRGA